MDSDKKHKIAAILCFLRYERRLLFVVSCCVVAVSAEWLVDVCFSEDYQLVAL